MKWLGQHRVTGKTKSTGSITTGGPIILQENLSGQLDEHKTVKSTSALTLKGTNGVAGNITLDASNDIYLNADGGDIVFKDDSAVLGKISTAGLSFVDNTGAGVIFEGSTDDAYNTTLTAADTTSSNKTITLPDATGTVALTSDIQKGWHGSTTRIKILPSDFVADDGGRPVMIEDDDLSSLELFLFSNGSFNMFAYIAIPTGYQATHAMVYGSDTSQTFRVYEGDINSKTISVASGSEDIGTEKALTSAVASDSTNYLVIYVSSDGSSDEIYGGYVTIEAT